MADLLDRLPVGSADEHLRPMLISARDVTISLEGRDGFILLRGPETEAFHDRAARALNLSLPREPTGVTNGGNVTALWRRPGGWLLQTDSVRTPALLGAIADALGDLPHLALDLSHQYVRIRISGAKALALLAKGCPLDLDPNGFTPDRSAGTYLGDIPVIIRPVTAGSAYDLLLDQSLARFAWWWLEELAQGK